MAWDVYVTDDVKQWARDLKETDPASYEQVGAAIDVLAETGPDLGRPLVDRVKGSSVHNLKELRPGSTARSEIRILFVFDPWRSAILLVAGDKSGNWDKWYRSAIPHAEGLLVRYLKERAQEEQP